MTYLNEYLLKEQTHLKILAFRCLNRYGVFSLKSCERKKNNWNNTSSLDYSEKNTVNEEMSPNDSSIYP